MNSLLAVSALSVSLLIAPWAVAADTTCSKDSPPHTVALLELYTSEGCSSCPPADRFVSGLRAAGLTSEQVVPLSLHVDYWDHIGWKDPFASRTFTERQRWLSAQASSRVIYTPEIFVAGKELRDWRSGAPSAIRQTNGRPAQAQISISLGQPAKGGLPVEIRAKARAGKLFVALFENGLSSKVMAGENSGTLLKHDYVVRDWIGPLALTADGGKVMLPRPLAVPTGAVTTNLGVAAFVQGDRGEIEQALALPMCAS